MHGLINHSYQTFLVQTCGWHIWQELCRMLDLREGGFEPMLSYEPAQTEAMVNTSATLLGRGRNTLLEDFGAFVIANPANHIVPRLLRMGGDNYYELLANLSDLEDRIHIAIPKLDLPRFSLKILDDNRFELICDFAYPNYGAVFLGMLRAMAEQSGELVLIDKIESTKPKQSRFDIRIVQSDSL